MSITVDKSAVKRVEELRRQQKKPALMLRVTVEGGGCSGFQYKMELTGQINSDDQTFENSVITDTVSIQYLEGSTVRFDESLIGAEFIIENPNAKSGCGCGASFSV